MTKCTVLSTVCVTMSEYDYVMRSTGSAYEWDYVTVSLL